MTMPALITDGRRALYMMLSRQITGFVCRTAEAVDTDMDGQERAYSCGTARPAKLSPSLCMESMTIMLWDVSRSMDVVGSRNARTESGSARAGMWNRLRCMNGSWSSAARPESRQLLGCVMRLYGTRNMILCSGRSARCVKLTWDSV